MKSKRTGKRMNGRRAVRPARLAKRSRFNVAAKDDVGEKLLLPAAKVEIGPGEPREAGIPRRDALQLYLREIGEVKLLTAEEEIKLAKRIKRGDKAAREHMIKANLRLVVKIARDYEG